VVAAAIWILALAGALIACYDVPTPDCGFGCGALDACPDGYVCAGDRRCHRIGAPHTAVCNSSDAAPVDSPRPKDAPTAGADAPHDAASDASTGGPMVLPADVRATFPVTGPPTVP